MSQCTTLHFFLGANTPQGFVSRFDQLADPSDAWREFVIKGGPGTGKSSLMKKIAEQYAPRCKTAEIIHCSSDPSSLDGVILHGVKTSIADGTSPHVIEPKFPGAFEQIVDLSGCWDMHKLYERRQTIMELASKNSRCHDHCCRFLNAAGTLLSDTYRIALDATSVSKVAKAAGRIALKEFKGGKDTPGKESVRFISALTNIGYHIYTDTAKTLCDRIYLVDDIYGATSRILLNTLRSKALDCGYDIISCYCPLSPFEKLEHLFIPELRIGFMTMNDQHNFEITPYKIIRSRRFTDPDAIKAHRRRLSFNKKAAAQLLDQAAKLLAEAKSIHDRLEEEYIGAMDFKKVDAVSSKTMKIYDHIFKAYGL